MHADRHAQGREFDSAIWNDMASAENVMGSAANNKVQVVARAENFVIKVSA